MFSNYVRSNILGLIAVFIALGGTAVALPGRNTVDSADIANGQVKAKDIGAGQVRADDVLDDALGGDDVNESLLDTSVLQRRVHDECPSGQAIRSVDPSGAVICEADDTGGPPSGSAGGDLSGTYPNPTLANGSVVGGAGGEVSDNSITGADVFETSLQTPAVGLRTCDTTVSDYYGIGDGLLLNWGNKEDFDNAGMHAGNSSTCSDGANVIVPPNSAGIYHVSAQAAWQHDPDGVRKIVIQRNGINVAWSEVQAVDQPGIFTVHHASGLVPLTGGDVLQVRVNQRSGTPNATSLGLVGNETRFQIAMISAP